MQGEVKLNQNICPRIHKPPAVVIYDDYDCPLCEAQKQVIELKARLNYIQNSRGLKF